MACRGAGRVNQELPPQNHLVVTGWESLSVLSAEDGGTLAMFGLPCQPIQPPLVVDYSSDGWNDIIITCAQR